jgi:hypothetical protein
MNIRALTHLVVLVAPLCLVACNGEVDPGRRTRGDSASSSDNGAAGKADELPSGTGGAESTTPTCDPSDPTNTPGYAGKDPGKDPGEDPGKDPNADPTKDPNGDPGNDPGKDPGNVPGKDPGKDPGAEPGKDPGAEPTLVCIWDIIEKGGACLDGTEIKEIALAKCDELGWFVSALDLAGDCAGGATLAKLSCCVDIAPLP